MIDIILIIVFFVVLSALSAKSFVNSPKNLKEFAIGHRFKSGSLIATVLATWIGGSSFFISVQNIYDSGLYHLIPALGMGCSFIITAWFFIPKMGEFLQKKSLGEAVGEIYGTQVQRLCAFFGGIPVVGSIAIQIKVTCIAIDTIFPTFSQNSLLLGFIITTFIILYTMIGGIKSVIETDLMQIITFSISIPVVIIITLYQKDSSLDQIVEFVTSNDQFNVNEIFQRDNPKLLSMFVLGFYFAFPAMRPSIFQRFSLSKDLFEARSVWIKSGLIIILIELIFSILPISFAANQIPVESGKDIFVYILKNNTVPFIKGLLIIGIISMSMSTIDSYLNNSAILIVNDLFHFKNATEQTKLRLVRLFVVLLGFISFFIYTFNHDFLTIVIATNGAYMAIISPFLLLTFFGFRTSKNVIIASIITGCISWSLAKIYLNQFDPIIFGMVNNLLSIFFLHYVLKCKGGFNQFKDQNSFFKLEESSYINRFKNNLFYSRFITKLGEKKENIFAFILLNTVCFISLYANIPNVLKVVHVVLYITLLTYNIFCILFDHQIFSKQKENLHFLMVTSTFLLCLITIFEIASNINNEFKDLIFLLIINQYFFLIVNKERLCLYYVVGIIILFIFKQNFNYVTFIFCIIINLIFSRLLDLLFEKINMYRNLTINLELKNKMKKNISNSKLQK